MTKFTYAPDGQQATLVAVNGRTSDQTTTYTYGTTLADSWIATSLLLRYVDYPDSTGGSDRVARTYNRLGQRTTITDQRGCVHSLLYDLLGRFTNDCVTTLGTGVDGTVRRLTAAYEVRGLTTKLTSYDNPTVGSGSIVNDVGLTYNSFGQLISDTQSHSGAVVPGTTPLVQYAYANGSSNTIRPTTLTYPNGRAITVGYGTTGGINDSITRVDGLIDGSTTLVNYAYLGLSVPVQTMYTQPSIQYTLLGSSTGTSPAGDIYWGLDQFGRIIDSRWFNTGTSADVDRIKYGYDRASNRIWRQNPVATAAGAQFDELYTNDGLQRLKDMQRGTLNSTNTGITVPTFEQCWTLDPTGNWLGFHEATLGGWPLDQSRTANTVNEITGITNTTGGSWATPTYDAAGNMTTIPRVSVPVGPLNWATLTSTDWSNLTTDQWSSMDVGPSSSGTGNAFTATYDAWNRLITIADASTGQTVQQNQYDARTFRTVILSYTAGVLLETRHSYFSSEWRCIEERVGTATTAERQFVWGVRYIDDLILRDRGTERMYTLQDTNWNVTSIAASSGAIQERYAYSAYGTPNFLTSTFGVSVVTSFNWETLFCGYRYDGSVHLFQVRFRAYNAWLGCWCKRDPIGYVDGASLYEYARSIPLNAVDAMGLEVYICFRAFQDQDNKPYFRKNSRITGCPIAHVFLSVVDESGKTTTYSFHPDEFTATPNKRRRGRVWKNDPRDVRCSAGVGGDYECFEISKLKGQERRFLADVEKSISEVGVGREEGAGIPKTEQTESHKDPAPGCSMDYWVLGQNCAWWSTTTLVDVGQISPRDIGAERFRERKTGNPWNNGYGVYSFADPQGEGGMNGKPNTPRTFLTQPGCFKSDITGPIK